MKQKWHVKCPRHGNLIIKQKSMPTKCTELVKTGPRSERRCGDQLSAQTADPFYKEEL
jgi:hypothetical protein